MAGEIRLSEIEERDLKRSWGFTPRELDVVRGVLAGMRTGEIARHLGLAPDTVRALLIRARCRVGGTTLSGLVIALLVSLGRIRTGKPGTRQDR